MSLVRSLASAELTEQVHCTVLEHRPGQGILQTGMLQWLPLPAECSLCSSTGSIDNCQQTLHPHLPLNTFIHLILDTISTKTALPPGGPSWSSVWVGMPLHFLLQGIGLPVRLCSTGRQRMTQFWPRAKPYAFREWLRTITDHSPVCLCASIPHL